MQHKSELGAVWLGLRSEAEVTAAFARLEVLAAQFGGTVLAERMAARGVELIVAARADAVVPALVIGLGGAWTEVLDDVAIVPLPADAARIERAVRRLRGAPLLTGARGTAPVDLAAVARMAERVGQTGARRSRSSCSSSTRCWPGRPARSRSTPWRAAVSSVEPPVGTASCTT